MPTSLPILSHRLIVVRHGYSEANAQRIIISDPHTGCSGYGLAEEGRAQVTKAAKTLASLLPDEPVPIYIYTSDFCRTLQTATILQSHFSDAHLYIKSLIRERYFGDYEGTSNENYEKVWTNDSQQRIEDGVESTESVLERSLRCLLSADKTCGPGVIVFVSHGDTLQILQTAFEGIESWEHRSLLPLETAGVRELVRKNN